MVWESRIGSAKTRRLVIAAVMFGLLGASTGAAVWMTESRRVRFDASQPTHELGDFRFSIPSNFEPYAGEQHEGMRILRFIAPEPEARILRVVALEDGEPHTPLEALGEAQRLLSPVAGWGDVDAGEFDGRSILRAVGDSIAQTADRQLVVQMHVMALVTADAESYLAVYLTGTGRINAEDVKIAEQIAVSAQDRRYEKVDATIFEVPKGMTAMANKEARDGAVYVAPESGTAFMRLVVKELKLEAGGESEETAGQRLREAMGGVFEELYGHQPPNGAMAATKIGKRDVQIMLLSAVAQSATADLRHQAHRELWGSLIDEERAISVEIIADPTAVAAGRTAAAEIMQSLTKSAESE